jgi:hypothetical protein
MDHPNVRKYIAYGRRGGCNLQSQKISNRPLWYRTKLPTRIDGFMSGMSQYGPWLCFRTAPRLSATNTLYVVNFKLDDQRIRAGLALSLLSSRVREQLVRIGRRYADGLVKFEPGDLSDVRLQLPPAGRPTTNCYRDAVDALLSGQSEMCMQIADALLADQTPARPSSIASAAW